MHGKQKNRITNNLRTEMRIEGLTDLWANICLKLMRDNHSIKNEICLLLDEAQVQE